MMQMQRRLVLAALLAALGIGLGMVIRPFPAAVGQAALGALTVGVACDEGAVGTFVVTLRRDGVAVGDPRTLQCPTQGAAETTFTDLLPGLYTVTETAGSGTDLANYDTFWRCDGEFRSGTSFSVTVNAGQHPTCVFLNRLVRSGTLEVTKECRGRSTAGRFRIALAGTGLAFDVGCGERFLLRLPPGSYTLVETTAPGTDPAAYQTVAWCRSGLTGPVSTGTSRVSGVVVRAEEQTDCQVINIYLRPF